MSLYPPAEKLLLPESISQPRIKPVLWVLHTTASTQTLESLHSYWLGADTEAHFGLEIGGRLGQFIDTGTRADSQSAANSFIRDGVLCGGLSVETSDLGNHGDPSYLKSWTDLGERQALEDLLVWGCQTHGIPAVPAFADGRGGWVGIGYHAQVPSWSNAAHICPGPGKIAEVPDLIAAVARRLTVPRGTVLDFLFQFTTPADIKAAGVVAVGRYVGPSVGESGNMDFAERKVWNDLGIAVFAIREAAGSNSWRKGPAYGRGQGTVARYYARAAGIPDERPIVCADYDESIAPADFPACLAYQQAWNDGGGQGIQSAYGEGALLVYLKAHGAIRFGMQSQSTSYPGNASISTATNLLQTTQKHYPQWPDVAYDEDFIITTDFGQHPSPNPPPEDLSILDATTKTYLDTQFAAQTTFLTKMLRGDGVGSDAHDTESIEGAVTAATAARTAANAAGAAVSALSTKVNALADQLDQLNATVIAISGKIDAGTGGVGGVTEAQVEDIIGRTVLQVNP